MKFLPRIWCQKPDREGGLLNFDGQCSLYGRTSDTLQHLRAEANLRQVNNDSKCLESGYCPTAGGLNRELSLYG
jgi:hypothetical protein